MAMALQLLQAMWNKDYQASPGAAQYLLNASLCAVAHSAIHCLAPHCLKARPWCVQGVWHALNRQDWSSDVAPLAAALAEKVHPYTRSPLHCLIFAAAVFRSAMLLGGLTSPVV